MSENPCCHGCGGPHRFDTTLPSPLWNRIIRGAGLPDYLCLTCIVQAFATAGEGFTAQLYGEAFNGLAIEIVVNGSAGQSAAALSDQNTELRSDLFKHGERLREMSEEIMTSLDRVCRGVPV